MLARAEGCLLGQLAGDALGSLVEFQSADQIRAAYPEGVRLLHDGGTWDTIAGQPTDDSELALALARLLVRDGEFRPESALAEYKHWLESPPFDCGNTIRKGLCGQPDRVSQANGALMRISPLGIFGAKRPLDQVMHWARQDAALTHPHQVCQDVNALFVAAIATAIRTGEPPSAIYRQTRETAAAIQASTAIFSVIEAAATHPPAQYDKSMGWVLIAFQNALFQLLHAPDLESGVVDTISRGGDTDTNAAIAGALLGAVYGRTAIPGQWSDAVLNCRPDPRDPRVQQPRPQCYWPVDALELSAHLLGSESHALEYPTASP